MGARDRFEEALKHIKETIPPDSMVYGDKVVELTKQEQDLYIANKGKFGHTVQQIEERGVSKEEYYGSRFN